MDDHRLRVSDADRDRAAARLREAIAEGRIDAEEHRRRIDVLYAATTRAEIVPVLDDLPERLPADVTRPGPRVVSVFSARRRTGRWFLEPRTTVVDVYGLTLLDLTCAVLPEQSAEIGVTCVFGLVIIRVPPGVRVEKRGSGMFGLVHVSRHLQAPLPDAPVVRVRGIATWGLVLVRGSRTG